MIAPTEELRELQPPPPPGLGWRYGYCRMVRNPDRTSNNAYGYFKLRERDWYAPLEIKGVMYQMPPSASKHGFSINTNLFDRRRGDCRTTEPTWDPYNQPYGQMNTWPSQVGDLDPVIDNAFG